MPVSRIYISSYLLLALLVTSFAACRKAKLQWKNVERLESHTTDRLNSILFLNGTVGYVAGGDRFYKSTILTTLDGGTSWQVLNFPEAGKAFYGIARKNNDVYACGFDGKLLYTSNGGTNWSFHQLANWQPYKDLAFIEPGTGIIVGGVSFNYGCMAYIDNNHKTFRFDTFKYELNCIQMVNNKVGYIGGYGVIMKTTDNGVSWHILDVQNDNITALHTNGENEVWACGYNGSIFYTNDGGNTWKRLRNGNSLAGKNYRFLDIVFKDHENGWVVGEKGIVLQTSDGGNTWTAYKSFTSETLRTIAIAPDGNLITAGDNGALYKLWLQ